MKQYRLQAQDGAAAKLHLQEIEPPALAPGEVRVKIEACSLNYRDLIIRSSHSAESVVPLSDGAGVIVEVGPEVSSWQVGEQVALTFFRDWVSGRFDSVYHQSARGGSCDGVLAETVVAPAHSLVRVPAGYDPVESATLPCAALTAWHAMMERGRQVGPEDTILCLGTGGVSIFALQIAKAAGARVIITSSSDEKLEKARALGADKVINYRATPDWDREVYRLTEKRGVDGVIEVGGPDTLEKSMQSVAEGGFISLIGVLTGFGSPNTSLFPLVTKNAELHGIYVGSNEMFVRMNAFIEKHQIRPVIDSSYSFEDAASAYAKLEGATHLGKIVITM